MQRSENRIPWRDFGNHGHACLVYANERELLDSLTDFVVGGLWAGEGAVVIATLPHLDQLEIRLRQSGLDLAHFRGDERYLGLSAEAVLSQFMVDGRPDPERFDDAVGDVVARARAGGRPVRIFGELVDMLWRRRSYPAAIGLEHLWNRFLERESAPVLCAYSRAGFADAGREAIGEVERAHTLFVRE